MSTPDLNRLRNKLLSGEAGDVRPITGAPPPVDVPTHLLVADNAPPLPPRLRSAWDRADAWLDAHQPRILKAGSAVGAVIGFGFAVFGPGSLPSSSFLAILVAAYSAGVGFIFGTLAFGIGYFLSKQLIEHRTAVGLLAAALCVVVLLRACTS